MEFTRTHHIHITVLAAFRKSFIDKRIGSHFCNYVDWTKCEHCWERWQHYRITSGKVARVSRVIHIALEQKKGVNGIISTLRDAAEGAIAKRRICGDYSLGGWQEIVLRTSAIDLDMAQVSRRCTGVLRGRRWGGGSGCAVCGLLLRSRCRSRTGRGHGWCCREGGSFSRISWIWGLERIWIWA